MTLSMASVLSPFAKFVLVHRSSSFLSFETLERRREERECKKKRRKNNKKNINKKDLNINTDKAREV